VKVWYTLSRAATYERGGDPGMAERIRADLTVPEVAQRLDVTQESVRRLLRHKRLRGYQVGGRKAGWRVRSEDLEAFIETRMNTSDRGN
jgi:excisionase family DNA binding protein